MATENNMLTGTIPTEILSIPGLGKHRFNCYLACKCVSFTYLHNASLSIESLFLTENLLSSSIPTEVGLAFDLRQLSLGRNELSGSLPTELGKLLLLGK